MKPSHEELPPLPQADPAGLQPAHHHPFSDDSIGAYLQGYASTLRDVLGSISGQLLHDVCQTLKHALERDCTLFVAGNGGSAAIAAHFCCDFTKGLFVPGMPSLRTWSLSDNSALLSAILNDCGPEEGFATQLALLARPGDVLLLLSSSGNSANMIRAAQRARSLTVKTIAFTGFSGGQLGSLVDLHIHIPFSNYGIVEDAHQALMHAISQYLLAVRLRESAHLVDR